jgi:uncharacterized protein YeaO (DUF488 family)
MIRTGCIYAPAAGAKRSLRFLVTRYWPRGVKKSAVDLWDRRLAPSVDLIRSYKGGKLSWAEFGRAYLRGLAAEKEALRIAGDLCRERAVTLLCMCRDENRCHRALLKKQLDKRAPARGKSPD